jgi:hypothetical protein
MTPTPEDLAAQIAQDEAAPFSIRVPEYSEWHCVFFGRSQGMTYRPLKGEEPCWFHRKMQALILGHKWERV